MSGSVEKLRLAKTVFHRGKFIREVTVRKPTQADVDEACATSETALGRGIALVSIVCGLDPLAALKLSDDDKERIQAAMEGTPVA
jgi:hypothetical protein